MTDRTFHQYAQGFGSTPCQVVCQIDGNTVFSGAITTVDQPWPALPDPDFLIPSMAWSWQDVVDFEGTKQISITVTGSPMILAQTFANNPIGNVLQIDEFGPFYSQEIDDVVYYDPFTDEAIDGVAQSGPFQAATPGQWWWPIPAGSTFTATMHVIAPLPESTYIQFDSVPVTIQPGASGTFTATIPKVDPNVPLPQTYGWKVLNQTTTDADFQASTGTVIFDTPTASFNITTVAHDPPESPKTFRAQIYGLTSGNVIVTSNQVTIT